MADSSFTSSSSSEAVVRPQNQHQYDRRARVMRAKRKAGCIATGTLYDTSSPQHQVSMISSTSRPAASTTPQPCMRELAFDSMETTVRTSGARYHTAACAEEHTDDAAYGVGHTAGPCASGAASRPATSMSPGGGRWGSQLHVPAGRDAADWNDVDADATTTRMLRGGAHVAQDPRAAYPTGDVQLPSPAALRRRELEQMQHHLQHVDPSAPHGAAPEYYQEDIDERAGYDNSGFAEEAGGVDEDYGGSQQQQLQQRPAGDDGNDDDGDGAHPAGDAEDTAATARRQRHMLKEQEKRMKGMMEVLQHASAEIKKERAEKEAMKEELEALKQQQSQQQPQRRGGRATRRSHSGGGALDTSAAAHNRSGGGDDSPIVAALRIENDCLRNEVKKLSAAHESYAAVTGELRRCREELKRANYLKNIHEEELRAKQHQMDTLTTQVSRLTDVIQQLQPSITAAMSNTATPLPLPLTANASAKGTPREAGAGRYAVQQAGAGGRGSPREREIGTPSTFALPSQAQGGGGVGAAAPAAVGAPAHRDEKSTLALRMKRALAPPPDREALGILVDSMVKELKRAWKSTHKVDLNLVRRARGVYAYRDQRLNLEVVDGKLAYRAGGGHKDLITFLERKEIGMRTAVMP